MELGLQTLASSSSGNSYLIKSEKTNIILDIGIGIKKLNENLAEVGLGLPEILALGAATYPPEARINARATESTGILTATVSRPPVVSYGTASLLKNIMVKGPGQK